MSDPAIGAWAQVEFKTANAWRHAGQERRAELRLRGLLDRVPDYTAASLVLAELLEGQGRIEDARDVYARAEVAVPLDGGVSSRRRHMEERVIRAQAALPMPPPLAPPGPGGRIAIWTDCAGVYGAQQVNHAIALALAARGEDVCVVQPPEFDVLAARRVALGIPQWWYGLTFEPGGVWPEATREAEARAVLEAIRPALVVFGDGWPSSDLPVKRVCRALAIPYVVVVHCVMPDAATTFAAPLPEIRRAYDAAAAVVAVSAENLGILRSCGALAPDAGEVVLNGRPASFFEPPDRVAGLAQRRALQIPADAFVSTTIARLDKVKGHHFQIQAMARLRAMPEWTNCYFVWAGCGQVDASLRASALALDVADHLRFLGERDDVTAVLDMADAFSLSSLVEGMPVAIMEAMAKGLPVVASAVSGVPEELADTGVLLPDPGTDPDRAVSVLEQTWLRWLRDPAERRRVGEAGRVRAAALFQQDRMVGDYLRLIGRVLERSGAGRARVEH